MRRIVLVLVLLAGCVMDKVRGADDTFDAAVAPRPDSVRDLETPPTPVAEVRCQGVPAAGPPRGWRHYRSSLVVALGAPHHRGVDLIAGAADASQVVRGKLTYGATDKDLEDEDIDVFACSDGAWRLLATVRTDGDGRFALTLAGAQRLPVGLRDLYLSVAGDRTGARFVALVAPATAHVVVSDLDGTLTSSENAYPETLVFGGTVAPHAGAPEALAALAARGYVIVYVTARGDRFTQDTRDWLATNGFPPGPLRMPSSIITMPGEDTTAFKSEALASVAPFVLAAGIGNRATDIAAYAHAGLPPRRIFIKLAEFVDEVEGALAAQHAIGFASYNELSTGALAALP